MTAPRFIGGQAVVFLNGASILEPLAVVGIIDGIDGDTLLVRYSADHYMKVPVTEAFPVQNELFCRQLGGVS